MEVSNRALFKSLPSREPPSEETPARKPEKSESQRSKGKKVLGVEFAPIKIPLDRRLETTSVILLLFTFFLLGPTTLFTFGYLTIYTSFWFIPIAWYLWYYIDRKTPFTGGRSVKWMRKLKIWKYYVNYFPISLVKTADLDPKKNYLFCVHPHGVLCSGAFGNFATDGTGVSKVFPGITFHVITLDIHYSPFLPFYRDFIMSLGGISCSRESLNSIFNSSKGGQAGVLMVGGAPESLECHPNTYVVHLLKRKGFVKVAMRQGGILVPVFSFGETNVYDQVPNPHGSLTRRIQDKIQSVISLAPVIMIGRGVFQYSFGILPQRKPITTVVGKPLQLPKIINPTNEEVDHWHKVYVEALKALFYENRSKFDESQAELVLI